MPKNGNSTELDIWYICDKLVGETDPEEILKWLKRLEKLTKTMYTDYLVNINDHYNYHTLQSDAN